MEPHLADHLPRIRMPQFAIEEKVRPLHLIPNESLEAPELLLNEPQGGA